MTHHQVIFAGRKGWFTAPVFVGDKKELAHFRAGYSCDLNWSVIAHTFERCGTLDEFAKTAEWAANAYHYPLGNQPKYTGVQAYRGAGPMDSPLFVHEDLSKTGLYYELQCASCNVVHPFKFLPSGQAILSPRTCCFCGAPLECTSLLPTAEAWQQALDLIQAPPKTYCINPRCDGALDSIASIHSGAPLKCDKIVTYREGLFHIEVLFQDWSRAIIPVTALAKLTPP